MIIYSVIVLLSISTIVSTYYAIRFALLILRTEDAINESLDLLDERYESMSKVLEVPMYADTPELRRIRDDIMKSQDAVLYIANILTGELKEEESGKKEDS